MIPPHCRRSSALADGTRDIAFGRSAAAGTRPGETFSFSFVGPLFSDYCQFPLRCGGSRNDGGRECVFVRAGLHGSSLSAAGGPRAAGEVLGGAPQELFPGD